MTRTDTPSRATRRPSDGRILRLARSPEAPKMTRSAASAMGESVRAGDDDVGGGELVMGGAPGYPSDGQREKPDHGLSDARERTVHGYHPLSHDQAPQRATRDAPACNVVGGRDAQQDLQARSLATEAGKRRAEGDVDRRRAEAVGRGGRDARSRFAAADPQKVQAGHDMMDGQLRQRVQRPGESRAVAVHLSLIHISE